MCCRFVTPAPRLAAGGVDGLKLSSGSVQSGTGTAVGSATGPRAAGNRELFPVPKLRARDAFCGVLNPEGGGSAVVALVLRSGSLRAASSARLSLWAERSAFSAAAVVAATCGVTL